jgi:hypothetical protein
MFYTIFWDGTHSRSAILKFLKDSKMLWLEAGTMTQGTFFAFKGDPQKAPLFPIFAYARPRPRTPTA